MSRNKPILSPKDAFFTKYRAPYTYKVLCEYLMLHQLMISYPKHRMIEALDKHHYGFNVNWPFVEVGKPNDGPPDVAVIDKLLLGDNRPCLMFSFPTSKVPPTACVEEEKHE